MRVSQQKNAVDTGYWLLFRYDPSKPKGKRFRMDCDFPTKPISDFLYNEARFTIVVKKILY